MEKITKKIIIFLSIIAFAFITTGCSLEDFGFEYTTGTGLNITKEKYERINEGDSYFAVTITLGGKCDNYYSNSNENWYTCVDNKDSTKRIVLKFVDGKLQSKSSSGLY